MKIRTFSELSLRDVRAGQATPEVGAYVANSLRNEIMEEIRRVTSGLRRTGAKRMKKKALPMKDLIAEKVQKRFGKDAHFHELTRNQRSQIFRKLRPLTSQGHGEDTPSGADRAAHACFSQSPCPPGRSGLPRTRCAPPPRRVWSSPAEPHGLGGAAAGLACGPAAPFAAPTLFILGGFLGGYLGDVAGDNLLETDLAAWLDA